MLCGKENAALSHACWTVMLAAVAGCSQPGSDENAGNHDGGYGDAALEADVQQFDVPGDSFVQGDGDAMSWPVDKDAGDAQALPDGPEDSGIEDGTTGDEVEEPTCEHIPESVLNPFAWYYQAESQPQTLSVGLDAKIPNIKQCVLTIDGESHTSQYDGYENGWSYANWRFDQTGQNYCGGGACNLVLECPEGITIRYWIWRTASITLRDEDGTVSGTCALSGQCSDDLLTHEVICNAH